MQIYDKTSKTIKKITFFNKFIDFPCTFKKNVVILYAFGRKNMEATLRQPIMQTGTFSDEIIQNVWDGCGDKS